MIVNIGEDNYVLKENILGILDRKSAEKSEIFKEFIDKNKEALDIKNIDENVKSYILIEKDGDMEILMSKISSKTLEKRNNLSRWR